jgi:hypothetical protein
MKTIMARKPTIKSNKKGTPLIKPEHFNDQKTVLRLFISLGKNIYAPSVNQIHTFDT